MTPLDWAEENEHVEVAEYLSHVMNPVPAPVTVSRLARIDSVDSEDTVLTVPEPAPESSGAPEATGTGSPVLAEEEHMNALIHAAHHGDVLKVRALLQKLTDFNFVDEVSPARILFLVPLFILSL